MLWCRAEWAQVIQTTHRRKACTMPWTALVSCTLCRCFPSDESDTKASASMYTTAQNKSTRNQSYTRPLRLSGQILMSNTEIYMCLKHHLKRCWVTGLTWASPCVCHHHHHHRKHNPDLHGGPARIVWSLSFIPLVIQRVASCGVRGHSSAGPKQPQRSWLSWGTHVCV